MSGEISPHVVELATAAAERPSGFGRIKSTDPRDKNYPLEAVTVPLVRRRLLSRRATLPDARLWRLYRRDQIDQGNPPWCVEASARHAQLSRPIFRDDPTPFGTLYAAAKLIDGAPGQDGTNANAMLSVLRAREAVASWWWYTADQDPELLDRWLLTQGPVMFGANWTDLMLQTDDQGRAEVGDGPFYLGHEVVFLGFNRYTKRTTIVNSWGLDRWGIDGRGTISYEDRAKLFDPTKGWADAVGVIDARL